MDYKDGRYFFGPLEEDIGLYKIHVILKDDNPNPKETKYSFTLNVRDRTSSEFHQEKKEEEEKK